MNTTHICLYSKTCGSSENLIFVSWVTQFFFLDFLKIKKNIWEVLRKHSGEFFLLLLQCPRRLPLQYRHYLRAQGNTVRDLAINHLLLVRQLRRKRGRCCRWTKRRMICSQSCAFACQTRVVALNVPKDFVQFSIQSWC